MNHSDIARAFGFQIPSKSLLESIYPYAPVYRLNNALGDWIMKRTQKPLPRGRAVVAWTQALAAQGVRVVTPARGFGENPRAFQTGDALEEIWVVYPFIAGNPYAGISLEIGAAGDLLGSIHATEADTDYGLKRSETVVAVEDAEIEQDMEGILKHIYALHPEVAAAAKITLSERAHRYIQHALPALMGERLPLVNCSWDFKASNLIYPTHATPVLVDADNAGRIPRAYDLAIATLLFHNEGMGTCRIFTPSEWRAFLEGYFRHVQLTGDEKRTWNDLLLCAWIDEALWLLRDDQQGWADVKQSQMLLSLLLTDLSTLALPA